jgi:hypothetical protein
VLRFIGYKKICYGTRAGFFFFFGLKFSEIFGGKKNCCGMCTGIFFVFLRILRFSSFWRFLVLRFMGGFFFFEILIILKCTAQLLNDKHFVTIPGIVFNLFQFFSIFPIFFNFLLT